MTIRCSKRAESAFNRLKNDWQVLNAYLAHKPGYRPDLHRGLGCGARGSAKKDRGVKALYVHRGEPCVRQDGA